MAEKTDILFLLRKGVTREEADAFVARCRDGGLEPSLETLGDRFVVRTPADDRAGALAGEPQVERVLGPASDGAEGIPVFPDHLVRQVMGICVIVTILLLLAAFFPPGLTDAADPASPPPDARPAWTLVALHKIINVFPEGWGFVGVVGAVLLVLAFLFYPALDGSPRRRFAERPIAWVGLLLTAGLLLLTVLGGLL